MPEVITHLPMFGRPTCGFAGDATPTPGELIGTQLPRKVQLPEGHELLDSWLPGQDITCPECAKAYAEAHESVELRQQAEASRTRTDER